MGAEGAVAGLARAAAGAEAAGEAHAGRVLVRGAREGGAAGPARHEARPVRGPARAQPAPRRRCAAQPTPIEIRSHAGLQFTILYSHVPISRTMDNLRQLCP